MLTPEQSIPIIKPEEVDLWANQTPGKVMLLPKGYKLSELLVWPLFHPKPVAWEDPVC